MPETIAIFLVAASACTSTTTIEELPNSDASDAAQSHIQTDANADMAQATNSVDDMAYTTDGPFVGDMSHAAPIDMESVCGGNGDPCCANKTCNTTLGCMHDNINPSVYTCRPGSSNGTYCGAAQEICCATTTGGNYNGYCYAANATCDPLNGNTVALYCRTH